jgi:hypothetical protein
MLMRFHFGLGVGHTYSHHRTSQAGFQDAYLAGFEHDIQDCGDAESHDEDEEEEDSDFERDSEVPEEQFSSSSESLSSEFHEMYDSDLELDYEN